MLHCCTVARYQGIAFCFFLCFLAELLVFLFCRNVFFLNKKKLTKQRSSKKKVFLYIFTSNKVL